MKWGAGLRASQALILAGKARALLAGRFHVSVADIRALAPSVLRHRIITTFYADAEQVTPDGVIARLHRGRPGAEERALAWPDAALGSFGAPARPRGRGAPGHDGAEGPHHRRRADCSACTAARTAASAPSSPSTGPTCTGDDPAWVDWKVYARSDRYYVKKWDADTNLTCHLLLDTSASMGYGTRRDDQADLRRVRWPRRSRGSSSGQRDAVGLTTFDEHVGLRLPARARAGHLHQILLALERLRPSAGSDVAKPLRELAEGLERRGLIVLDLRSAGRSGRRGQRPDAARRARHGSGRLPRPRRGRADVPVRGAAAVPRPGVARTKCSRCRRRCAITTSPSSASTPTPTPAP